MFSRYPTSWSVQSTGISSALDRAFTTPCTAFLVFPQEESVSFCLIFSALRPQWSLLLFYSAHLQKSESHRQKQVMRVSSNCGQFLCYHTTITMTAFECQHGWTWEDIYFSGPIRVRNSFLSTLRLSSVFLTIFSSKSLRFYALDSSVNDVLLSFLQTSDKVSFLFTNTNLFINYSTLVYTFHGG